MPFDPEGLLGILSAVATVLFGYLAGGITRKSKEKIDAVGSLYTIGLVSLGIGLALSIFLPINKSLWTPSYVFYAGGWTVIMLAFFIYLIDIKGKEKFFFPFKALGLNPLFAFVMAAIFAKTLGGVIKWQTIEGTMSASRWLYLNGCVPLFGDNEFASLFYALVYVTTFTLMAIYLYKKKIIIKL